MAGTVPDIVLFLPETVIFVTALLLFASSMFGRPYVQTWAVSLLGAAATCVAAVATAELSGEPFYPGIYRVDLFSQVLKAGISGGLLLVLLLMRSLETVRPGARADMPLFLMLSTAGMMLLVSSTELLTLYVSLELSAYGLYVAVALHRRRRLGSEAGVRYVVLGAAASAVTLYGLSLIFGATGTTYLSHIAGVYAEGSSAVLTVGFVLMSAGFFFKLAVFPFHFWAPDVYEGAPHQIVTFVGTISKLTAAGIIARVCSLVIESPGALVELFMVISVASMTLGNLAAVAQRDLKRMLAYSTVAHAGYLMLGFGALSEVGLAAVLFYAMAYVAMAHLGFVVVCALGRDGSNPTIDGLGGLHQRSPGIALMLLTAMFALAGIPPTAGFVAKWFLFAAVLQQQGGAQFVLVLLAAINSTVALYYYLQVVKAAYLLPADGRPAVRADTPQQIAGYVSMTVTLVAGVYPAPLWELAQRAATLLIAG